MVDLKNVHARGVQSIQLAYEEAASEYRQAQIAQDEDAMAASAMKMAGLEAMAEKFNGMANRAMAQSAQPVNKYGLSPEEIDIARNSFGAIKQGRGYVDLSDDEKQRLYYENREKYRSMLASGKISRQGG